MENEPKEKPNQCKIRRTVMSLTHTVNSHLTATLLSLSVINLSVLVFTVSTKAEYMFN